MCASPQSKRRKILKEIERSTSLGSIVYEQKHTVSGGRPPNIKLKILESNGERIRNKKLEIASAKGSIILLQKYIM